MAGRERASNYEGKGESDEPIQVSLLPSEISVCT